jgi:hypothetical protein
MSTRTPPADAARAIDPDADLPSRAAGGLMWRAVILATAVALAFADASIVVLGLPSIYGELQTTVVEASWASAPRSPSWPPCRCSST